MLDSSGRNQRNAPSGRLERARAIAPFLSELTGMSARAVAAELNARQVATPSGAPWSAKTVIRARERLNRPELPAVRAGTRGPIQHYLGHRFYCLGSKGSGGLDRLANQPKK